MKFVMGNKSFVFRFSDIEVREREFSLLKAGKVLAVEPKAFRVLLLLLRNPQKLISKEELLNSVWGDTAVGAVLQEQAVEELTFECAARSATLS